MTHSVEEPNRLNRDQLGAVYTSETLAAWAAGVLRSMMPSNSGTVIDPACGDGALLAALSKLGFKSLVGVDCDPGAIRRVSERIPRARFHLMDGLVFLSNAAGKAPAFDGAIANPPWGARLRIDRPTLTSLGYRTLQGQADSWDLFVEGLVNAARPNVPLVLILPDALFLPEHQRIREKLTRESTIELIARLGEGFFKSVYRGTVVLAIRKGKPAANGRVNCIRLPPDVRKEVLAGRRTLAEVVAPLAHQVPQARLARDAGYRFDIDTREHEDGVLLLLEGQRFPWDDWFEIGRGIELSKTGRIVRCPRCGTARPLPRVDRSACSACGHFWRVMESEIESIVRVNIGRPRSGWHPLIVGEDVDRHACVASRLIRLGVAGIRYKSFGVFARPKLLIRKTGVGLKAVVDLSGAATNQVVFHVTCRPKTPLYMLDYLEGVLCSRVLLAWHLKRQGEIEWRSHPYITPRMIRKFPIPVPRSRRDVMQSQAIADAVRARRSVVQHGSTEDLTVERLVAGMYGLTGRDMQWVLQTLDSVEPLEPIRTLRLPTASLISPKVHRREAHESAVAWTYASLRNNRGGSSVAIS